MTTEHNEGVASGGVLLVGSVPLRSAEEVFQVMAAELGDRLRQVPDGETGPRSDWIVWQYPVLSSRPEFEVCPPGSNEHRAFRGCAFATASRWTRCASTTSATPRPRCRRSRCSPAASATGRSRRTAGSRCRSRLRWRRSPRSWPPRTRARIEPLYEARIFNELATIFEAIPHDQLAVQWDTNFEFAMLDGVMPAWFDDPRSSIVERLVRLGRSIPADVQLGYHFCHGHERHHRERPYDAQALVDIANALSLSLGRSLDWVHLPGAGRTRRRRRSSRRWPSCRSVRRRACTSVSFTPPTASPAPRRASSPPNGSSTTSASPPTAGGAATDPRTSRR